MINHSDIRTGIRKKLLTAQNINVNMPSKENIYWENRKFNPTPGVPYIKETLLPGEERPTASATIQGIGIAQYDIVWPANEGTEKAENLADDIKNLFKPVTSIVSNINVFASITRAERFPALQDDVWYMIPIRLTWRAFSIG